MPNILSRSATPTGSQTDSRSQLIALLKQLPPETIWRDVHDAQGNCLAKGVGFPEDGLGPVVDQLDFHRKTVLDLGCNLGHNTFLALEHGAHQVVGVDYDPLLIQGARLMAEMNGLSKAKFITSDFHALHNAPEFAAGKNNFDMVMLVDFFGKNHIRQQQLEPILRIMTRYACHEILLTLRPLYRIPKHFGMTVAEYVALYPSPYIQGNHLHVALQAADILMQDWLLTSPLESHRYDEDTDKILLHFTKR